MAAISPQIWKCCKAKKKPKATVHAIPLDLSVILPSIRWLETCVDGRTTENMLSSWLPGIREFDSETILVKLGRIRRDKAREALTRRVNHVQVAIGTVVPTKTNIRTGGLSVGRVHLQ